MKCAIYECNEIATPPFICCDSGHGFRYKQNVNQAIKYLSGEIDKSYLKHGIFTPWADEEIEYYCQKAKERKEKYDFKR